MIPHYEIYYEDSPGHFVPAPNPPPKEWRERKGVCRTCGEKVFVKAGDVRSFWTHGMGKTCVPKPNRVDAAISVEEYEKNRGALEEGDEELLKSFEEAVAAGLSHEEGEVEEEECPEPPTEPPRILPRPWTKEVSDFSLPRIRTFIPPPRTVEPKKPVKPVEPERRAPRVRFAASLGWIEATLVSEGRLTRIKDIEGMPDVGTSGNVAIHYQADFPRASYDEHRRRAHEKYQGCTFPTYDEIASRRKNYYWAVAGFTVVSEGGTRYMNLTGVKKLTTFVFHINEGRKVWQLDNFDSQMIH